MKKKNTRDIIIEENLLSFADNKFVISDQNLNILKDYVDGMPVRMIGKKYNVCYSSVRQMIASYVKKCHKYLKYGENEVTIGILNNASIIILDSKDFLSIKIDKTLGIVTESIIMGRESGRDITEEVLSTDVRYAAYNTDTGGSYTLGLVIKKLLRSEADSKCKSFIKLFDRVIIE